MFFTGFILCLLTLQTTRVESLSPNFFSSTPKSIPPIGKRESYARAKVMETENRHMMTQRMISTLNQVFPYIDRDEDGMVSVEELVRIPVIWKALQTDWKEVLAPEERSRVGPLFRFNSMI